MEECILLYGDSLTAGFTDGGKAFSPYGTTLEAEVGVQVGVVGASGQSARELLAVRDSSVLVETASTSIEWPGLATLIKPGCGAKLVVLLLGTNDLFKFLADNDASAIAADIVAMHTIAHDAGVKSVCVGIPGNGPCTVPQIGMEVLRMQVNAEVEDWTKKTGGSATFVPFPVAYGHGSAEEGWEPDGIHMNARGYQKLGVALAPVVKQLLGI